MDAETLDLLIAQVNTQWARPLDDYEIATWCRHLVPETGQPLDPEFVAEALLLAKHSPAFEFVRPDLIAFASFYRRVERAHEPPAADPEDPEATAETVRSVLAEARRCLAHADEAAENLARERSKLLHAMVKADIRQGRLL